MSPIWKDTSNIDAFTFSRPKPTELAPAMKACLANKDIDTVTYAGLAGLANVLIAADRDTDINRVMQQMAKGISQDSLSWIYTSVAVQYMLSPPVRFDRFSELITEAIKHLPSDSTTFALFLRTLAGGVAIGTGHLDRALDIRQEVRQIIDTLPLAYKNTPAFYRLAKEALFPFIGSFMTQRAEDSLSTSTQAYRNYLVSLWKEVVGDTSTAGIGPLAMDAPEPKGHFWYSNMGADGLIHPIQPTSLIKKGKVTILYFIQGGCHGSYRPVKRGRENGTPSGCWQEIHQTKKIMKQYPNIQLVLVSNTFGSLGNAPPLTPQQEADTLASYFLGFHQLRGTQVVYQTKFFRLPTYDNRKIDEDTENHQIYTLGGQRLIGANNIVMIDEEGKIFHWGSNSGSIQRLAEAKLRVVMNRPANRLK